MVVTIAWSPNPQSTVFGLGSDPTMASTFVKLNPKETGMGFTHRWNCTQNRKWHEICQNNVITTCLFRKRRNVTFKENVYMYIYITIALMAWKRLKHYWSFLLWGPICGALIFSFKSAWTSCWTKSRIDSWDAPMPMLYHRNGQRDLWGMNKIGAILLNFSGNIFFNILCKKKHLFTEDFSYGPNHNKSSHYLSQRWRSPNRRPISKKLGLKQPCSFPSDPLNDIDSANGWLPSDNKPWPQPIFGEPRPEVNELTYCALSKYDHRQSK